MKEEAVKEFVSEYLAIRKDESVTVRALGFVIVF